jgi:hypothetical protein
MNLKNTGKPAQACLFGPIEKVLVVPAQAEMHKRGPQKSPGSRVRENNEVGLECGSWDPELTKRQEEQQVFSAASLRIGVVDRPHQALLLMVASSW